MIQPSHKATADKAWVVTERKYHGTPDGRFVVHLDGAMRGPVEFLDKAEAERVAAVLNTCESDLLFTGMFLLAGPQTVSTAVVG